MSPCEWYQLPSGGRAVACSRGPRDRETTNALGEVVAVIAEYLRNKKPIPATDAQKKLQYRRLIRNLQKKEEQQASVQRPSKTSVRGRPDETAESPGDAADGAETGTKSR